MLSSCSSARSDQALTTTDSSTVRTVTALEAALRRDLGMTPEEYGHRTNAAQQAQTAARRLSTQVRGVEIAWLAEETGTPELGVSTDQAERLAKDQGWSVHRIPARQDTDARYRSAQRWLAAQPDRIRESIVLMWPDYTSGAINAARNVLFDPTSAPQYPPDLQIREVPGSLDRAAARRPLHLTATTTPPHPGDAFKTGKNPTTTCTIGVPTVDGGFITVEHCTGEDPARTVGGTVLGTTEPGPNDETRRITGEPLADTARSNGASSPITTTSRPLIGAPICKPGARSGWQCGTIVGLDGNDTFISTACSLSGDSGGPALMGTAAVGVTDISTIGTQSSCPAQKSTTLAYTIHRTVVSQDSDEVVPLVEISRTGPRQPRTGPEQAPAVPVPESDS